MNREKLEYFDSKYLIEIQELFLERANEKKIEKESSSVREIREFMFDFFQTTEFITLYFNVAEQIVEYIKAPFEQTVLQSLPTPRVFRPKAIGTTYHCDYWYGHGERSHTVWVPLSQLDEGNTFHVASDELARKYVLNLEKNRIYAPVPEIVNATSTPVLPDIGQAYIFNSRILHGSPLNNSTNTRLSFDFRISNKSDSTSTKDLENYYHYQNNKFQIQKHLLDGARVMKYVCGGHEKNSYVQHIIIDAAAKRFNMNVYEEEAEIERLGFPIFEEYVTGKLKKSKVDAMLIASRNILDEASIKLAKNERVKIWCALENNFLGNL
jgi:ectoine hydroxylase-related dioxygenase (phytanoyl-CoA dioxygenase family)